MRSYFTLFLLSPFFLLPPLDCVYRLFLLLSFLPICQDKRLKPLGIFGSALQPRIPNDDSRKIVARATLLSFPSSYLLSSNSIGKNDLTAQYLVTLHPLFSIFPTNSNYYSNNKVTIKPRTKFSQNSRCNRVILFTLITFSLFYSRISVYSNVCYIFFRRVSTPTTLQNEKMYQRDECAFISIISSIFISIVFRK